MIHSQDPYGPEFVSLLKNVRGVVHFRGESPPQPEIDWLMRKFRYRNLGIVPAIFETAKEPKLTKKPFVKLEFPNDSMKRLVEFIVKNTGMPNSVVQTLFLASSYVSPIILLKENPAANFAPFLIHTLNSDITLTDKEIKLHLRIVDYTVLDFHKTTTKVARIAIEEAIQGSRDRLNKLINERKKLVQEDCKKRYWRLISRSAQKGVKNKTLIFYLDSLPFISAHLDICSEFNLDTVMIGFGIVAGFVLDL
ncbi:MAG TPA: hypothetical protein EYP60_04720 [bacterium (Candidatus Stahlbacteria)]|nr:hypothetical protein [Candidatus Stahlbacteria bacterium]